MQVSWKDRLAAATASVGVIAAINFPWAIYRYNRPRELALARYASTFDFYSGGKHAVALLIAQIIVGISFATITIVPYELTLYALTSDRFKGED